MGRIIGKNISLFNVASEAFVGRIRNAEIEINSDQQENRALADTWAYPVGRILSWRCRFTIANFDTTDFTGTKTDMTRLQGEVGSSVAVVIQTADANTNGTNYAGNALLASGSHSIPDGLQEGSFELIGQGSLGIAQM